MRLVLVPLGNSEQPMEYLRYHKGSQKYSRIDRQSAFMPVLDVKKVSKLVIPVVLDYPFITDDAIMSALTLYGGNNGPENDE